ncbi:YitT family protein [Gynuella sp.]|uniref:YitT family protein n=1 Tax=Gynuella sp. TaxID=2969146 RepID=UPI003D13982C
MASDDSLHSLFEDLFALFSAGLFISFGVFLFKSQGLLTGGTAGIALVGSKLLPFSFGQIFFIVNLPFYYLAWKEIGLRFTLNTFISVTVVSVFSEYIGMFVVLEHVNPYFAGVMAGILIGVGMLIMFRHKSSLGGVGILAFYLQHRFNIRAGFFQLAVDCAILLVSYFLVSFEVLAISVLSVIMLNLVIAVNHKPGRYRIA